MKLELGANNRMLIYFFFDREGVVDDYILYMLREMKKCVKDIVVVSNGKITDAGKKKLGLYVGDIIERDNKGFDVWAYKTALERIGWEKLALYDEVIMMNYTIMGPVYPLREMFDAMDVRDLDFWGPTISHKTDFDPWGTVPYGYLPDHIQSHFIAVRRPMLMRKEFRSYWEEMPMINSYQDSVGRHEAFFTKHFADMGFCWDVYANSESYRELTYQPLIMTAREMVEEQRCPFFKRRSFMHDYTVVLSESVGQAAVRLYEYLDQCTDYDINLIWDNILRAENQADIKKNLQLNYVLPSDTLLNKGTEREHKKVALIMHMYFPDLIPECVYYARSMPPYADIYITTNTPEKKAAIEKAFAEVECHKLDVRIVPNRGRDVGPFLVESREYLYEYDYICHTHDKKVGQLKPGTVGQSFSYRCFENVLRSREFVENIIETFERNPRMGILMPPPPNHADYFITLGLEWGLNFGVTKELAEKLDIHVPMSEEKEPIAPLGSVFWARTDALRKVFDYPWTYEELPEEPIVDDGTVLHAVERIYNYSAQAMGYYPGWLFSDTGADMEITNLYHMLRTINCKLMFRANIAGPHHRVLHQMDISLEMARNSGGVPIAMDGKLYYAVGDADFDEAKTMSLTAYVEDNKFQRKYEKMESFGTVHALRFDPGEQGSVVVSNLEMQVSYANGKKRSFNMRDAETDGIEVNGQWMFLKRDPKIIFNISEGILEEVTVEAVVHSGMTPEILEVIQKGIQGKVRYYLKKIWRKLKNISGKQTI